MTPRARLLLTPLTCPQCAENLPALEDDVAFACVRCALGFELERDGLGSRPLRVAPPPASRAGFHLPFWEWRDRTRVPAFNTRDVVELSRRLSGREFPTAPSLHRLLGATLASADAAAIPPFAGLPAPAGGAALLAVPFVDDGNHLIETVTGFVLYKESIDRARALLAALAA